ncbi:enoyl-CoA hydratase/isomerase family protein [Spirillospora sp. NPDC000708]|uniref:Enoyl-CoA hydratase/isomerase family protein n=1 Tax=Actinomadura physcomitrii TaxID=2650748 RepID=A0A6I4MDY3_9ACTN|nr:enoyl-CoA hydratase/isomerase family protein [Actinomadura physcomitrii]MWA02358.1 enoyl-CoA hydratase/isomerase family protein [Actinomadura physcomitrii]MWA03070.1 enoyl-CoA hydratase/isomerase family protein [Actinomadura physcomitrii]
MTASVTASALVGGAGRDPLLDEDGQVVQPLLTIDLDDQVDDAGRALASARTIDRVMVGFASGPVTGPARELARALDVTLVPKGASSGREFVGCEEPASEAALLRAAASANPQAAVVLAEVLRAGGEDVTAGLHLESFAYSTLLGGSEFASWLDERGTRPLPPPAAEPVLVERAAGRLLITLNRPERRNAYGRLVRDSLVEALQIAALDDSVEQVVLTGGGPSFSAGGDLDEFGTAPDLTTAHFVRTFGGAGRLLHQLSDRVEARLNGHCVGAGIELPAFAGRVVAAPGATFRLPEVSMGLIPGAGGTVSVPRRIGRWRTMFMALSGRPLDVQTAKTWGLIDEIE